MRLVSVDPVVLLYLEAGLVHEGQKVVPKHATHMRPANSDQSVVFGLVQSSERGSLVDVDFDSFLLVAKTALEQSFCLFGVGAVVHDIGAPFAHEVCHVLRVAVDQLTTVALHMNSRQAQLAEDYLVVFVGNLAQTAVTLENALCHIVLGADDGWVALAQLAHTFVRVGPDRTCCQRLFLLKGVHRCMIILNRFPNFFKSSFEVLHLYVLCSSLQLLQLRFSTDPELSVKFLHRLFNLINCHFGHWC